MNNLAIQKFNGNEMPDYQGISTLSVGENERRLLDVEVNPNDVEIRPDGLIYVPEIKFRRVLNITIGPGSWSILPRKTSVHNNILFYKGALFIKGNFVAECIGEKEYFEENPNMSFATAAEAAKSNCLVRCCKDLGIYWQLWDPNFINNWIDEHAVQVWAQHQKTGKTKTIWRKRANKPYNVFPWKESGFVNKSDNNNPTTSVAPVRIDHHVKNKSESQNQNNSDWFSDYKSQVNDLKKSFSTVNAAEDFMKTLSMFSMKDESDLRGGEKLKEALSKGVIKSLKDKLESLQYVATTEGA